MREHVYVQVYAERLLSLFRLRINIMQGDLCVELTPIQALQRKCGFCIEILYKSRLVFSSCTGHFLFGKEGGGSTAFMVFVFFFFWSYSHLVSEIPRLSDIHYNNLRLVLFLCNRTETGRS